MFVEGKLVLFDEKSSKEIGTVSGSSFFSKPPSNVFLGIRLYGKNWKKIEKLIGT